MITWATATDAAMADSPALSLLAAATDSVTATDAATADPSVWYSTKLLAFPRTLTNIEASKNTLNS